MWSGDREKPLSRKYTIHEKFIVHGSLGRSRVGGEGGERTLKGLAGGSRLTKDPPVVP